MECWARLTPGERALLVWGAIGRSAQELTRLDPARFPNRMAVHRAATRFTERLTARMKAALGEGALGGSMGEVAGHLVEVLLALPALAATLNPFSEGGAFGGGAVEHMGDVGPECVLSPS